MSDMEDFIDVKVTRRGREVAEGCFKLPVTIGRGEDNSVRIGPHERLWTSFPLRLTYG
jgi:hypothetical protein